LFGHASLPAPGTDEARELCRLWDTSTSNDKRMAAEARGVTYGGMHNWRARCRSLVLPTQPAPASFSLHEHFRRVKENDELVQPHYQVPGELVVKIPTTLPVAICHTADWHMGQPGCDYDSLERDHRILCSEPGLYSVPGGDAYENIIQPSKIGSSHNQSPICVQKAMTVLVVKEQHEMGHLLFMGTGNHPYWSALATGEDWDLELARRLRIVYAKHGAMVHIVVGDLDYIEFWEHKGRYGSSFNQTHGPKQSQRVYHPRARIVVREHEHVGDVEQYRYDDNECAAIRTGTYAIFSDFAAQNGMYGAHICNPCVVLFPDRDHLVAFKFMEDALVYLRAVRAQYEAQGFGKANEHVAPV
jgi:hypothetical protein